MVFPHNYRTEHSETKTTNANYGDYYRQKQLKKINIQPLLLKVLQFADSNRKEILSDLKEMIKIKSIAGSLQYKDEVIKMIKVIEKWMKRLGAKYECFYIGFHELDGKKVRLPPVVLGTVSAGSGKKTVCIYGNIDVNKPNTNIWKSDPWDISERNKVLHGNGICVGKGALIIWFHAVAAMKAAGELPVNVKFIIEAMHYQNSEGLKDFLMTQKQVFLNTIDYIVVSDSEWIGEKYPCVTYGCVGILHFDVFITKTPSSKMDPKVEMEKIFSKIAKNDKILIPDFSKSVLPITPDEEALYESIDFDVDEIRDKLPPEKKDWSKAKLLMNFWRTSTIFVDEIKECSCEKKDMTKIRRHFVIKIVPKQISESSIKMVEQYIKQVGKELNTGNLLEIKTYFKTRPWLEDCTSINYEAAKRATIQIYKEEPSFIRTDRDYVCINVLQMCERPILLLPLGAKGSNAGESNENIPIRNFFEGIKLCAAYLYQIATLSAPK